MSWWTSREIHPKTKSKFVVVFGSVFYLPNIKSLNKPKIDFDTKEYRLLNHKFNYPGNGTWQPITMKFVDMNGMGRQQDHFDTGAFLWQVLNNTGYTYPYVDNSQFRDPHFRNVNSATADEFGGGHHISTKLKLDGGGKSWRTITTPEKSSTIANSFGLGLENVADFKNASVSKQRISIYQLAPFTGNEPEKRNAGREGFVPQGAIITECWHLVNPIVKSVGWGDLAYDSDDLVEYELGVVYDWAIMDRTQIGKQFMVSALPYKEFMKTLFVDNPEAITQRKLDIAGFGEADYAILNDRRFQSEPGALDLNGDGRISTAERNAAKDPNFDRVLDRNIEQLRQRDMKKNIERAGERADALKKNLDQNLNNLQNASSPLFPDEPVPPGGLSSEGPSSRGRDFEKQTLPPIEIKDSYDQETKELLREINNREANMEADIQKKVDQVKERRRQVQALTDLTHGPERKKNKNK